MSLRTDCHGLLGFQILAGDLEAFRTLLIISIRFGFILGLA